MAVTRRWTFSAGLLHSCGVVLFIPTIAFILHNSQGYFKCQAKMIACTLGPDWLIVNLDYIQIRKKLNLEN
jgi:hypothetical protein